MTGRITPYTEVAWTADDSRSEMVQPHSIHDHPRGQRIGRTRQPIGQLQPATLGNPSALRIGDDAIVVGNPFALTRSLSTGVISGLDRSVQAPNQGRTLTGLIQFDAAVNPGSSGGPLVNRDGEVVGIVTGLVNPTGQPAFSGVGFAVTIDTAAGALGVPPD